MTSLLRFEGLGKDWFGVPAVRDLSLDILEGQVLGVIGEYGAGKSHLMDIAEAKAREAGFVTSRVELDPREVPPSHPLRVYREIVSRLRYPGEACGDGLEPLAARLVETGSSCWKGKGLHRYLSPLVFAAGRDPGGEAWQAMLSYVEGRGTVHADEVMTLLRRIGWDGPGLLTLADWRTFGQVYAYLLGGIAAWSREAGWKGLAVFFDEAESIDSMGRQSQEFAETFLKYFAAASLPGAELPFRAGELRRGGHRVHREIPHVYRRGQPLIGVFAFTPHPDVGRVVESVVGRGRRIARLEHVGGALMPDLVTRIATVYREAYPGFRAARSDTQRLVRLVRALAGQGAVTSTRDVARLTVEYLDILRLRPDDAGRALEGP